MEYFNIDISEYVIISISIICIIIILLVCFCYKRYRQEQIYVTLTTIPERLVHPWFYKNLKQLMNLDGSYKVVLNVPYEFKRNNEPYIIPVNVQELEKDNLIINRVNDDYGPLTKLYGSLLNNNIPDDACLLICDDDIKYKDEFITQIYQEYIKDKNKIYTYCDRFITGFQGYMMKKSIIKPILQFNRPDSCFRLDDNFIQKSALTLNIPIQSVTYKTDNTWTCTFDKHVHDHETPDWDELKIDERGEGRGPKINRCFNDFDNINIR